MQSIENGWENDTTNRFNKYVTQITRFSSFLKKCIIIYWEKINHNFLTENRDKLNRVTIQFACLIFLRI